MAEKLVSEAAEKTLRPRQQTRVKVAVERRTLKHSLEAQTQNAGWDGAS